MVFAILHRQKMFCYISSTKRIVKQNFRLWNKIFAVTRLLENLLNQKQNNYYIKVSVHNKTFMALSII